VVVGCGCGWLRVVGGKVVGTALRWTGTCWTVELDWNLDLLLGLEFLAGDFSFWLFLLQQCGGSIAVLYFRAIAGACHSAPVLAYLPDVYMHSRENS
jgi:hypothetical protein